MENGEKMPNLEAIEVLERMLKLARESDEWFSVACAFAIGPEHGGKAIVGPLSMTLASVCSSMTTELSARPFDNVEKTPLKEAQETAVNEEVEPIEADTEA